MNENEGNKKSKTLLIVLVGALLLLNIFLGVKLYNGSKESEALQQENVDVSNEKKELEEILAKTEEELASFETQSAELSEVVSQQKAELEEKANKIKALLSRPNISKAQLNQIKLELANLKIYARRIEQSNDSMAKANEVLTLENAEVKQTLVVKEEAYQQLSEEKDNMEKIASKLKARGFGISAIKIRNSGKEVETSKASRADALKITYTIDENELAQAGRKEIYIKIIDPSLNTMVEKESTSGLFSYNGKSSVYTLKKVMDYSNKAVTETVVWKKGSDFEKGNYAIELYSDGNFIGGGKFSLR